MYQTPCYIQTHLVNLIPYIGAPPHTIEVFKYGLHVCLYLLMCVTCVFSCVISIVITCICILICFYMRFNVCHVHSHAVFISMWAPWAHNPSRPGPELFTMAGCSFKTRPGKHDMSQITKSVVCGLYCCRRCSPSTKNAFMCIGVCFRPQATFLEHMTSTISETTLYFHITWFNPKLCSHYHPKSRKHNYIFIYIYIYIYI